MRRQSVLIIGCIVIGLLTSACSSIGDMFSGSGPERPFDNRIGPDIKTVLKNRPEGLIADTANARYTTGSQP